MDSIRTTIDSATRYGIDSIDILALGVFPGRGPQPLPRNRLILLDYDFGSANHVTIFPKRMKPSALQKEYIHAYRQFNNLRTAWQAAWQTSLRAGIERLAGHMARRAIIADSEKRYLPPLYEVEESMYDEQERLLEHKLPSQGVIKRVASFHQRMSHFLVPCFKPPTLQGASSLVAMIASLRGNDRRSRRARRLSGPHPGHGAAQVLRESVLIAKARRTRCGLNWFLDPFSAILYLHNWYNDASSLGGSGPLVLFRFLDLVAGIQMPPAVINDGRGSFCLPWLVPGYLRRMHRQCD